MQIGDRVQVRFTKWGDLPHWELNALVLGDDDVGHWLGLPAGEAMSRPGHHVELGYDRLLVVADAPVGFVASFNSWLDGPDGPACATYVDITSAPVWNGSEVTMTDLDLDVVRYWTDDIAVLDEDEFAEHQLALGYPDDVVAYAGHWRDVVFAKLSAAEPPFDGRASKWFAVLAELTGT